jgi:choline-glycine betaine transporter
MTESFENVLESIHGINAIIWLLTLILTYNMFPPSVWSDVSRGISKESSLKLHLNSLLILLLIPLLIVGRNIP